MEVSPDGRTIYFGRYESYEHDRMNLGVISLDANGLPVEIRYFRDCTEDLQLSSSQAGGISGKSSVVKIVLDTSRTIKKLYLAVVANGFQSKFAANERSHLSIYDIGQDGFPISNSLVSFPSPISDISGNVRSLYSFAITNNKIYLVGFGDDAVWVCGLDPNTGQPVDPHRQPVNTNAVLPATP